MTLRKGKRKRGIFRAEDLQEQDILSCFNKCDLVQSLNQLHSLLVDKSDYEIGQLLTSCTLIRHFNISMYWMMHVREIYHFSKFLSNMSTSFVVEMLMNCWRSCDDSLQREIFDTIVLHIFNDYCCPNIEELDHSYRKKCFEILDELCFEYSSSLRPVMLSPLDLKRVAGICRVVAQSDGVEQVQGLHCHILARLFSTTYIYHHPSPTTTTSTHELYNDASSTDAEDDRLSCALDCVSKLLTAVVAGAGIAALEQSLREEFHCPLDYSAYRDMQDTCGSSSCPLLQLLLPHPTAGSGDSQYDQCGTEAEALCSMEEVSGIAAQLAAVGLLESNSVFLLRALCLLDCSGGAQQVAALLTSLCGDWGVVTHTAAAPALTSSSTTLPAGSSGCVQTIKDFSNLCMYLCEATGHMTLSSLRAACHIIRAKKDAAATQFPQCKEPADSFLQAARGRLKQAERLNCLLKDGGRGVEAPIPELTPVRIKSWADTYKRTNQLPVAVAQLCSLLGRTAYKKVLGSMCSLIAADRSLRGPCELIVTGMARHSPCLCPPAEASEFGQYVRREGSSLEERVAQAVAYVQQQQQEGRASQKAVGQSVAPHYPDAIASAIRTGVSVGEYVATLKKARRENSSPSTAVSVSVSGGDMEEVCRQWRELCREAFHVCSGDTHRRRRLAGVLALLAMQASESLCECVGMLMTPADAAPPSPQLLSLCKGMLQVFHPEAQDMTAALCALLRQALAGPSSASETSNVSSAVADGPGLSSSGWSLALLDAQVRAADIYSQSAITLHCGYCAPYLMCRC
jgi:hypothetical protein